MVADAGELQQALLNLCLNARDAMPLGGKLILTTKEIALSETAWNLGFRTKPGRYVVVQVADTGCGMSPEVRQRIFEPFFTTKAVGKGTGLGLAMVYGIAQQHNGAIEVASKPGRGSTFSLYLPCGRVEPDENRPVEVRHAPHGSETILLAEDEPLVRSFTVRILERAGYRVLAASDGDEALRIFEEHQARISLAILDVVMPGPSGREVYQRLKEASPGIRVAFCSGYDPDTARSSFCVPDHVRLIEKPIDADALLLAVREVLDEGPAYPAAVEATAAVAELV